MVVDRVIVNQRVSPVPLEARATAAVWRDGHLTVWASTQNAQAARAVLAGQLGLDATAVRVIAPDVGGGFGAKFGAKREEVAVAWAARRRGRPLRWAGFGGTAEFVSVSNLPALITVRIWRRNSR